ncbi:hypothetical protein CEN47_08955, partial [Fischerella thermalis CCMEE 5319]
VRFLNTTWYELNYQLRNKFLGSQKKIGIISRQVPCQGSKYSINIASHFYLLLFTDPFYNENLTKMQLNIRELGGFGNE